MLLVYVLHCAPVVYRATFTATYPEMRNVAGDGKSVFSGVVLSMGVALIFFYLLKEFGKSTEPLYLYSSNGRSLLIQFNYIHR